MTHEEIAGKVQSILLQNFNISSERFNFEVPLEVLQEDFKILGNLVVLEQLLQKEFKKRIPLLENISSAFHSTQDIIDLITKKL